MHAVKVAELNCNVNVFHKDQNFFFFSEQTGFVCYFVGRDMSKLQLLFTIHSAFVMEIGFLDCGAL